MITCGYLFGPTTQAVQGDPTTRSDNASVLLLQMYWPAAIAHPRQSFPNGAVPFRCPPGTCVSMPFFEAAALVALGAARWE